MKQGCIFCRHAEHGDYCADCDHNPSRREIDPHHDCITGHELGLFGLAAAGIVMMGAALRWLLRAKS